MAVNHRLLYWGAFFIAIGAVVLVGQANLVTPEAVADALRFWPIVIIALGVGLVLKRTRLNLAGGMLAAVAPGLLLGGLIVAAPEFPGDCRVTGPIDLTTQHGTFDGAARVDLELACGEIVVTTTSGSDWEAQVGSGRGSDPVVTAEGDRLTIEWASQRRWFGWHTGRDEMRIALPTAHELDLSADVSAGRGEFDLEGARLGTARFTVNAGDNVIDLADATVTDLTVDVNAAKARIALPSGSDLTADLDVNAGDIEICVPSDLGVRVVETGTLATFTHPGLVRSGDAWESPNYATAVHHADLSVSANVGSVDVNPEGGCK